VGLKVLFAELRLLQCRLVALGGDSPRSNSYADIGVVNIKAACPAFSLCNLMSNFSYLDHEKTDTRNNIVLVINFAIRMCHMRSSAVILHMQDMPYVLRRRLVRMAHGVYQSSLQLDGERLTEEAKASRYTELVCFLLDASILRDVLALRLTCKSNNERRRFPVCFVTYRELEANIIEEWLVCSGCSSRFVSSGVMCHAVAMHDDGRSGSSM